MVLWGAKLSCPSPQSLSLEINHGCETHGWFAPFRRPAVRRARPGQSEVVTRLLPGTIGLLRRGRGLLLDDGEVGLLLPRFALLLPRLALLRRGRLLPGRSGLLRGRRGLLRAGVVR